MAACGALAALGVGGGRRWPAAGWLRHPVWDGLHLTGRVAPEAYAWLCLGFDGVVGLALLRR